MHNLRLPVSLAVVLAACSVTSVPVANAFQTSSYGSGGSCQLSIPTTNTKFRAKATGARNESTTTSNFVICPVPASTATSNDYFTLVMVAVYSLDGVSRNVSCTAVTGSHTEPGNSFEAKYSTKSATVADTGSGVSFDWLATDFGGSSGAAIPASLGFSVTCNLPPQTAINYFMASHI